jgi:hypothetical protein
MHVDVFWPFAMIGTNAELSIRIRLMRGRSTQWTVDKLQDIASAVPTLAEP